MDDIIVSLSDFVSNSFPVIGSAVITMASAVLASVFMRKNTSSKEFEIIKAGKMKEAIDMLVENRHMTYAELYKAKNFLKIAKKADECYKEIEDKSIFENNAQKYSFDWFIKFFEYAGAISDEDIQNIWARKVGVRPREGIANKL